jgi:hypothetical protein
MPGFTMAWTCRAHYGEVARAIFSERVALPFAVGRLRWDSGASASCLSSGYIHLRLGRDANDKPFGDRRFIFRRDDQGARWQSVRIPRGTLFNAGDALGRSNRLNHVHFDLPDLTVER